MKEKAAVDALAALAQESRLRVFRLLVSKGEPGLAAGAISRQLGIPPATLSFHLHLLEHAGLIGSMRTGRSIIYAVRIEGFRALLGFLAADCCGGRPELCAPVAIQLLGENRGSGPGRRKGPA